MEPNYTLSPDAGPGGRPAFLSDQPAPEYEGESYWEDQLPNFRRAFPQLDGVRPVEVFELIRRTYFPTMEWGEFMGELTRLRVPAAPGSAAGEPPGPTAPPGADYLSEGEPTGFDWMLGLGISRYLADQYEQERSERPTQEKIADWTRAILNGLTAGGEGELVGVVASIHAIIEGRDPAEAFRTAMEIEDASMAAFREENPVGGMVAEAAGALPWLAVPAVRGPSGPGQTQAQVAHGVGTGALASGLYTGLDTPGTLEERLSAVPTGMAVGAGAGAALPMAGSAVQRAGGLTPAVRPTTQANRRLESALSATDTGVDDIVARLSRNEDLMPLDVNPLMRQQAQGIAVQPGPGAGTIRGAVGDRAELAGDEALALLDETLGTVPNVERALADLQVEARAVGGQYDPVLAEAGPVDISRVVAALDARLARADPMSMTPLERELQSIRNQLAGETPTQTQLGPPAPGQQVATQTVTETQAPRLHEIQSELRDQADRLSGPTSSGTEQGISKAIMGVRNAIVEAIDAAADGAYRPIHRQYADAKAVEDAFQRGWSIMDNPSTGSRGQEARPEFWETWTQNASASELEAARLGARARIDSYVESSRFAENRAQMLTEVGLVSGRLEALFGSEVIGELSEGLSDLGLMIRANSDIDANSQTEFRRQGALDTEVARPGMAGATPGALGLGAIALGEPLAGGSLLAFALARRLAAAGEGAVDRSRNAIMADTLTATGDDAARALSAVPRRAHPIQSYVDALAPVLYGAGRMNIPANALQMYQEQR